ncbi:hypothetical protein [Halorussus gelatinilyticus]|nr:hypothetical protein [Halorussus gelatinilyticus]
MLYEATIAPGLADAMASGGWSGEFLFNTTKRSTAEEVKKALDGN